MLVKQKDILNILKPFSMSVVVPGKGTKIIKLNDFVLACIESYKKQVKAVNVKYSVEYLKNESEV